MLFHSLVLSALLYGVEVWNPNKSTFRKVRTVYRRCLRGILLFGRSIRSNNGEFIRIIKTTRLLGKLNMPRLEDITNKRILTWVGKIVRMDEYRLPRYFL